MQLARGDVSVAKRIVLGKLGALTVRNISDLSAAQDGFSIVQVNVWVASFASGSESATLT